MRRIIIIAIISGASFMRPAAALSQLLGPLGGALRYEHQYQDVLVNNTLLTSLRRSPSLTLNTTGIVTSENFIYYTLRTSLNTTFRTTHSASTVVTTKQYLWNAYDVNVFFFQIAPANFQLSSREYTTDTRYEYEGIKTRGGTRNHEDRVELALVRVPFMPLVNFSYRRMKAWSIVGEPYENHSNQYTLSASSRNGTTGHASVIGNLSEFRERASQYYERIVTVQFEGSNTVAEGHQVSVGSEYYKFGTFSSLSGGLAYGGTPAGDVLLNSGINGQRSTSRNYSAHSVSTTHGLQFTQSPSLRIGLGLSGGAGATVNRFGSDVRRIGNHNWSGSVNLNHTRNPGGFHLTNNVSLSYGQRLYWDRVTFYRVGINNSANRSVGRFTLAAAYNFSYLSNRNSFSWNSTEHFALLSATGVLPASIRSRTSADFRSYVYGGGQITASDQSVLNLAQTFDGSFRHVIPFTLGAGASVHYFFIGIKGHTYGWNASFQSPRFFLAGLLASYRYARSYDPYYRRESLEHTANLSYRWRLVSFQLSMRERRVFNRLRDVRFTVERSL